MKSKVKRSVLSAAMVAGLMIVGAVNWQVLGADEKPAAKGEKGQAKERAKPKGNLPNYYKDIITGEQREKIYTIQASHEKELAALQMQVKALQDKIKAEIEAVLTPEQIKQIAALVDQAKAKAKAKTEKPAETKTEKPAEKTGS